MLASLKKNPRTSDIPMLIISVVDQPGFGKKLGADEYLLKPLEPQRLRSAVQKLVGSRSGSETSSHQHSNGTSQD